MIKKRFKHQVLLFDLKTVVKKEGTKLMMSLKRADIVTELVDGNTLVTVKMQMDFE